MSGMGQTALAKVVFDKIHNKFDASNFLEDVREASKDTCGLEKLQDQLLHDMKLKCNGDLRKKIQMISNGLYVKKGLLLLLSIMLRAFLWFLKFWVPIYVQNQKRNGKVLGIS